MISHVTRSQRRTCFGFRYRLRAQIITTTPRELRIIKHSRLGRMEVFHDPQREELMAAADAAHARAKARGLFVTKARDAAAIAGAELSTLIATYRALRAFRVSVAELLSGVTIEHKSLQAITEIERAIVECIDNVDRFVTAARGYADVSEDIFAPGDDANITVPPAEWTRTWRR